MVIIKQIANIKGPTESYFDNWKFSLLELVEEKIARYSSVVTLKAVHSVFDDPDVKAELNHLKKDFVIVPIDKAANNVSFICKQHYAEVIASELNYKPQTKEKVECATYESINITSNEIVESHKSSLNDLGLSLDEGMDCLPSMYWTPRLHKDPVGNRFIIASPKCSTKPLLKDVTSILKLFQKQIQNFHDKNRVWTGVSNYWIIQNNWPVVERMTKISAKKGAKSIRTFDFSTLYTNIPHHLLKDALYEIVDFCFKGGISNGVYVTDKESSWRQPSKDFRLYSKQSIKDILSFVIDNAFFQVGSKIFRQIIGIPMGSDPAPFIANLFYMSMKTDF